MGIRSLNTLIKKYSPDSVTEHNVKEYADKVLAIDCSILIYKYVHMSKIPNSHIIGFANRINYYLKHNILPVFVFDGIPPDAKKNTLQKRQHARQKIQDKISVLKDTISDGTSQEDIKKIHAEIDRLSNQIVHVTKYHIEECKNFLKYSGIPYIQADGEAEKTCVYLKKINAVDYVVSDDTDTLTFGCESVLRTNIKGNIQEVSLNKILKDFGMSYTEFVDFCILCGCDYCPYIPSVGPQTSYSLIKKFNNIESIIKLNKYKIGEDFDFITARKLFINYDDIRINSKDLERVPLQKGEFTEFLKDLDFKDNLISKYIKLFS
jgi:flap endonuclease-1